MLPKANPTPPTKKYAHHDCIRHTDLSILAKNANVSICNTCFDRLKKTYFNVIAGLLLEAGSQHHLSRVQIEQNEHVQAQVKELTEAILRLQAEIGEIKNNGKDKPPEQPPPPPTPPAVEEEIQRQHKTPDTKNLCAEGHLAKVAHSLTDLFHIKVDRVMRNWRK